MCLRREIKTSTRAAGGSETLIADLLDFYAELLRQRPRLDVTKCKAL